MDKKKQNAAPEALNESDKQYLDKSGASTQLKDLMTKLIENRPDDPVHFISDYFDSLGEKSDTSEKACRQVALTHYTHSAFVHNCRLAYDILGQAKVGKPLRGISGSTYMGFLQVLCKDFSPSIQDKLFKKIQCRNHEVVVFEIFRSAVFTCLVLQDFVQQAAALYTSLDTSGSGRIDRILGEGIIKQLFEAISGTSQASKSVFDACTRLSPDKMFTSIAVGMYKLSANKGLMSQDDFVLGAAEAFLTKVKALK